MGFTLGSKAWDELIAMEGQIRKQRQETMYRQRERRQKFIEIIVIALAIIIGAGALIIGLFLFKSAQAYASHLMSGGSNVI